MGLKLQAFTRASDKAVRIKSDQNGIEITVFPQAHSMIYTDKIRPKWD